MKSSGVERERERERERVSDIYSDRDRYGGCLKLVLCEIVHSHNKICLHQGARILNFD